ncbi:MAG: zinc ribbon domain-containing protein [Planctomycetaceae bacterium]|nr:zinc ribbon domain-containing protein [Planctomycetaceae bacterium]
MGKISCLQCGTRNDEEAQACKKCGKPIERIVKEPEEFVAFTQRTLEESGANEPRNGTGIILTVMMGPSFLAAFFMIAWLLIRWESPKNSFWWVLGENAFLALTFVVLAIVSKRYRVIAGIIGLVLVGLLEMGTVWFIIMKDLYTWPFIGGAIFKAVIFLTLLATMPDAFRFEESLKAR